MLGNIINTYNVIGTGPSSEGPDPIIAVPDKACIYYIYIYITYTRTQRHTYAQTCALIYKHIHTHIHKHIHTHIYTCVHLYVRFKYTRSSCLVVPITSILVVPITSISYWDQQAAAMCARCTYKCTYIYMCVNIRLYMSADVCVCVCVCVCAYV